MIALFSPLVGFVLGMLFKKRCPFFAKKIILFFISLSFVSSVFILFSSFPSHVILWQWILNVYWGIFIDQTIAILLCMVSFISLIIHIYSLDYMSNDPQKISFLAQLSFFTFSMMLFLVSPHLLQLFVGWEAISLASYMLIGFWYHHKKACDASLKAFLVNRFADVFVILGIALFYIQSGTFSILTPVQVSNPSLISLLLFIGVMAKSAQIGFHIWLPDAMEGPTPVSALIHAATMVTAGIILMIRMPFLFTKAPDIQHMIVFIGCVTALYGAFFACTQTDIKKIIAYSTCSQLGFMAMSCGIGAYKIALMCIFG